MEQAEDVSLTLIIKAPSQRLADQSVICNLGWTIHKLKLHLETVYPSRPKHSEQKLIYSGKLLQDHLTLKEILRQYDSTYSNEYTLHLVCSTSAEVSSSSTSVNGSGSFVSHVPSSFTSSVGNTGEVNDNSARHSAIPGQTDGVRYRGHDLHNQPISAQDVSPSLYYSQPSGMYENLAASYTNYPYSAEQYAWMQQMHSQYMFQQYVQYYQSMLNISQPFNLQAPGQFMQHPAVSSNQAQPQQAQEAAPANNNAPAGGDRQNVRMNAQGGVEDDEEEGEPRDWLHHAYFFMRFLTFVAILVFYSNLSRFVVVFSGCLIIYILQKFRNFLHREQEQQNVNRHQNVQPQANNQQQQPNNQQQQPNNEQLPQNNPVEPEQPNGERREERNDVPAPEPGVNPDPQPQPAENAADNQRQTTRVVSFIVNTIQAFFTSLIPAPPELLQAN